MAEINLGRVVGPQGPQGEQGATGPQGPAGANGAKGDPGPNQVSASTKTEGFEDGQTLCSEGGFVRAKTLQASDVGALSPTGNASNVTAAFTQASTRANLTTGEKLAISFGKLMKWFSDLKTVAWSGNYNDLTNKPTALKNPNALTLQLNGENAQTYDGSAVKTFNVTPGAINAFAKTEIIPVANGGTGANTAALGRKNLGLHAFTMINTTNEQGDCTIDLQSILGGGIVYATGSLTMTTEDGGYLLFSEPAPGGINVKLLSRTGVPIKNRTFRANIVCGVSW